MNALQSRMHALRMTPAALARRSKLSLDAVMIALEQPSDSIDHLDRIRRCLGIAADGKRLVPNRTFRKHAARKKARFVVAIVQGTMGLEAQGLDPAAQLRLFQSTYGRFKLNPAELW